MLGLAVGGIGMSVDDFCRCSPLEFQAIAKAWKERTEQTVRQQWEQARMLCLCSLQPYTTRKMQPTDVMQFPWDGGQDDNEPQLTKAELMERFEKVKREQGI